MRKGSAVEGLKRLKAEVEGDLAWVGRGCEMEQNCASDMPR